LTPIETASIDSYIWNDANYNGIQDADEVGVATASVKLTRSYYDTHDTTWKLDEDFVLVATGTPVATATPVAAGTPTASASNGHYRFENLPTFIEKDGQRYLVGYQMQLCEMPEGYAATKYHAAADSNKDSDLIAGTLDLQEPDNFLILASAFSGNTPYCYQVRGVDYDIVKAANITGYDGGIVQKDSGASISGIVWDDADRDHEIGDGESGIANVKIILQQYYYRNGKWELLPDAKQTAYTNADGAYRFDDLPLSVTVDGVTYLAGYRLWIDSIPAGYNAEEYIKANNEKLSSGRLEIKTDNRTLNGCIVLGIPEEKDITSGTCLDGFNTAKGEDVVSLNVYLNRDPEETTTTTTVTGTVTTTTETAAGSAESTTQTSTAASAETTSATGGTAQTSTTTVRVTAGTTETQTAETTTTHTTSAAHTTVTTTHTAGNTTTSKQTTHITAQITTTTAKATASPATHTGTQTTTATTHTTSRRTTTSTTRATGTETSQTKGTTRTTLTTPTAVITTTTTTTTATHRTTSSAASQTTATVTLSSAGPTNTTTTTHTTSQTTQTTSKHTVQTTTSRQNGTTSSATLTETSRTTSTTVTATETTSSKPAGSSVSSATHTTQHSTQTTTNTTTTENTTCETSDTSTSIRQTTSRKNHVIVDTTTTTTITTDRDHAADNSTQTTTTAANDVSAQTSVKKRIPLPQRQNIPGTPKTGESTLHITILIAACGFSLLLAIMTKRRKK
ncbi:LPXTG cell wall anchor domain-containing protein, partial [uncultured Ruminococcus sp.]